MANPVMNTLKPLLKPLQRPFIRTRQCILGAAIRPVNIFYKNARALAMSSTTSGSDLIIKPNPYADTLRQQGLVSIEGAYDADLIRNTRDQFIRVIEDDSLSRNQGFCRTIRTDMDLKPYMPGIYDLIRQPAVINVLHSFYRSHFTLTNISGTRLFPIPQEQRTKENLMSAQWHCDDNPTDIVHLVVFLHDVTPEHGPTWVHTKKRTVELMREGFYTRNDYGISESILEDRTQVKLLTGKAGTAHLMVPGTSLHRAGIPEAGYIRDSLFFSLRPGLEPKVKQKLSSLQRGAYDFMQTFSDDKKNPPNKLYAGKDLIYA